ncbi:hypothetical protein CAMSH0001_0376 [Campylobacter showae RM3277]|uniref:Uncharacterized protein n=1 Tax=Campylobacter showae RM3277 TaxID=553219 RepID=C6RF71_9BACT|nr:hypothetical protein CAMSH0001_0376 [Campylobacter showae RM3277]
MAGLHQIYELNLSPKSVKSRLINICILRHKNKAGRLNLALKFNRKNYQNLRQACKNKLQNIKFGKSGRESQPKRT